MLLICRRPTHQRMNEPQQRMGKASIALWKSPGRSSGVLSNASLTGDADASVLASRHLAMLQQSVEHSTLRLGHVEAKMDRYEAAVDELRGKLASAEGDNARLRTEVDAAYKQLENDAVMIDRLRGISLDLGEQVKYLTNQIKEWRTEQLTPVQASYWALAGWIYVPLLHFIRGLWVLLHPIVGTFQHMTLFGYDPALSSLRRSDAEDSMEEDISAAQLDATRTGDVAQGTSETAASGVTVSLLERLRNGDLDSKLLGGAHGSTVSCD